MSGKLFTKDEIKKLEAELKERSTTIRVELLDNLKTAKAHGDLSENAEYHAAKAAQAKNESRMRFLERTLKTAQVVKKNTDGTVGVGSTVEVKKEGDTKKKTFHMVGAEQADMSVGKISYESPLGKALMGKKKGEIASFETPMGVAQYKVMKVD